MTQPTCEGSTWSTDLNVMWQAVKVDPTDVCQQAAKKLSRSLVLQLRIHHRLSLGMGMGMDDGMRAVTDLLWTFGNAPKGACFVSVAMF